MNAPRRKVGVILAVIVGMLAAMSGLAAADDFTTDNTNTPGELNVVTLKDGPFRELHGEWAFPRLRDDACKVGFDLTYEFSSGLLDKVIGPVFNHIATTFIDAFVKRAEVVYGEPR